MVIYNSVWNGILVDSFSNITNTVVNGVTTNDRLRKISNWFDSQPNITVVNRVQPAGTNVDITSFDFFCTLHGEILIRRTSTGYTMYLYTDDSRNTLLMSSGIDFAGMGWNSDNLLIFKTLSSYAIRSSNLANIVNGVIAWGGGKIQLCNTDGTIVNKIIFSEASTSVQITYTPHNGSWQRVASFRLNVSSYSEGLANNDAYITNAEFIGGTYLNLYSKGFLRIIGATANTGQLESFIVNDVECRYLNLSCANFIRIE